MSKAWTAGWVKVGRGFVQKDRIIRMWMDRFEGEECVHFKLEGDEPPWVVAYDNTEAFLQQFGMDREDFESAFFVG